MEAALLCGAGSLSLRRYRCEASFVDTDEEEAWEPGHIGERFGTYLNALVHPSEIRWKRLFHTF